MSSFFRCERMFLYTIILHPDSAFDCMVELGYAGCAQLVNVYDGIITQNRKYINEVQRCIELMGIIDYLQEQVNEVGMRTFYYPDVDKDEIPREKDLQSIETTLNLLEEELLEVSHRCENLQAQRFRLMEHRQVLLKTHDFLTGSRNTEVQITSYESMIFEILHDTSAARGDKHANELAGPLRFITGCLPLERFSAFEIMVWRVSRGNAHMEHAYFELPTDLAKRVGQRHLKAAFLIVFVGKTLEMKILKILRGFRANIYPCPETLKERKETLKSINRDLEDLDEVFKKSCEHRRRVLMAATPELYIWRSKVRKMHDVFFVLNRLGNVRELGNMRQKYLQADCWIPKHSFKDVRNALYRGARRAAEGDPLQVFPPILQERKFSDTVHPPTYFRTNKFTNAFQNLINAYGTAAYRELNPAPYTIITFPFLFAIMFGDTGHGLLLTLFSWLLIKYEERIQRKQKEGMNEISSLIFAGRYILLLMGIFSIYTGFIYNDHFSKTINLFGSSWRVNFTGLDVKRNEYLYLDPARVDNYRGVPYPIGIDPIWNAVSENSIIVSNSLKMKISIILGVSQMLFGLGLSACNAVREKAKIDFYCVFLPQLVFFASIFFYLVFLIFFKWYMYGGHLILERSAGCAPSILITFINMVLLRPAAESPKGCKEYMFSSQPAVQRVLLFTAIISMPILLCGKPIHFMLQQNRLKKQRRNNPISKDKLENVDDMERTRIYSIHDLRAFNPREEEEEEEDLSEVWIQSGVHTIECVLGSVSHTASYLRLWALSLAHSQLAHVLWKLVLQKALRCDISYFKSILIYILFAVFAGLTVFILIIMEGLSAFLHTLRLHWVEFQSKFYKGSGNAFTPFQFKPSTKMDAETQWSSK